jgi:hypothetical protein
MLLTFLATSRDTGGQFALLEIRSSKGAEPPPTHAPARGRALLHP